MMYTLTLSEILTALAALFFCGWMWGKDGK